MSQVYTILFDLDGTLIDTAPDLIEAHNHVMRKYGHNQKKLSDIKSLAGRGAWVMMERSFKNEIKDEKTKKKMVNEFIDFYAKNINNESLAKLIGKSPSYVSNILRLLELDKKIQEMVISGDLSMGHARALIGVPDAINKANEIVEKKLSVRQTEKITSEFKNNKKNKTEKDPNITDLEKELSDKIGLRTSIQFNDNGSSGSLTLYYSDLNQLDDLMKRLKK